MVHIFSSRLLLPCIWTFVVIGLDSRSFVSGMIPVLVFFFGNLAAIELLAHLFPVANEFSKEIVRRAVAFHDGKNAVCATCDVAELILII